MTRCKDGRWHAMQEEADVCIKHPTDKDFDNLSTISRQSTASRIYTTIDTIDGGSSLIAAPAMDHQVDPADFHEDDDQDGVSQNLHRPAAPGDTVQTRQSISDWLGQVTSHPVSLPRTDFAGPGTSMLQTPETPGAKKRYEESKDDQLATHDGAFDHGLDDATLRHIAATFGQDRRTRKVSTEGHNDHKSDHLNRKSLAENRRPWYADGDVQAILRALLLAVFCAVALFGLVLFLADRDTEKFP